MRKKITWRMIYSDFKKVYPKFHKEVTYWRPHSYATILLYFKDGNKAIYDYDLKRLMGVTIDD